jgi:2,4-dienoyl-CoA reductase-like NADH-dependent reductase (Old Yellow Enzyme family)
MALEHVLSPITINRLEIKNRVLRTAHGTSMGYGDLSDDLIAYHEARAKGGVGLSLVEASSVHWSGPMTMHAWDDSVIPRYELLVRKVHAHGMKMFSQINHMGIYGAAPWQRPWSASEVPVPGSPMLTHAMSSDEIAEMVDAFAQAARRAQEGGLDGVEVHCAHDFLLQQFISTAHNKRDDNYGGSFENRMRFYLEVLHAVRDMVGPEFVVGTRVGPHNFPGGLNVEEHVEIVNRVLQEGIIDYLNVSHGSSLNSHKVIAAMHEPTGYEIPFSEQVTALTDLPTFVTGRFRTLQQVDELIAAGKADVVGMTRAHIADPDLVRKTMAGRADEVRPCIGCNQGCVGGLTKGRVGCAVNLAAGQERRYSEALIQPATPAKHILVVGGGPAGMEAARVAALRGHRVTLAEAADTLGGTLRIARLAPKHESIGDIADWLAGEMRRRGVSVLLNTTATADWIAAQAPDAVILATGAAPRKDGQIDELPGQTPSGTVQDHVISTQELMTLHHNQIGKTAVVLDDVGAYEGIGAAEYLVEQGAEVTFVTSQAAFAPKMASFGVTAPALERLTASGRFTLVTRAHLTDIGSGDARISSLEGWPDRTAPADTVVLVTLNKPNNALAADVESRGLAVTVIGDANHPEFLPAAMAAGHMAGRTI